MNININISLMIQQALQDRSYIKILKGKKKTVNQKFYIWQKYTSKMREKLNHSQQNTS